MKKISRKTKFRVTFLFVTFIIAVVLLASTIFSYASQIYDTKRQMAKVEDDYNEALSEEERLNEEINRLQNPEYMAKYAREKYLYSKKDEIVIKVEE